MYCKNYLQQYSRTKSIRELSKNNRNSYKVISQQNSTLLKKDPSKSNTKTDQHNKSIQKNILVMKDSINRVKTNLQIRKNQHHTMKSVSSLALNNDADIQCRKSTNGDKTTNSSIKKSCKIQKSSKNLNKNVHLVTINKKKSKHQKSETKDKSIIPNNMPNKKLSIDNLKRNSQYSTIVETYPNTRYNSVANPDTQNQQIAQNMHFATPQNNTISVKQLNTITNNRPLQQIYNRMRQILQTNQKKQRQWQRQRTYYVSKISELQDELHHYHKSININNLKKERKRL